MEISIVTVVLNRSGFIKDCMKSVLSQTYENIEYIVIDGGSTYWTMKKDKEGKALDRPYLSLLVQ